MTARWERLRQAMRGDGTLPIGEALHPAVLAATGVLILNDWVWKPWAPAGRWQATVTGKLSDLAGLAAAPVLLTALIGLGLWVARRAGAPVEPRLTRRRLISAVIATGAGFTAIKISPMAAGWFTAAIGLVRPATVAPDRTDLLCLPMLAVAYRAGLDELRRNVSTGAPLAPPRLHGASP